MKYLIASFLLAGAVSAAYIDCRSESGDTRVRLDIDGRGNLKDIRFTRKIHGERWEMVGREGYDHSRRMRTLFLCNLDNLWERYPLCVREFDLNKGFISVIFRDVPEWTTLPRRRCGFQLDEHRRGPEGEAALFKPLSFEVCILQDTEGERSMPRSSECVVRIRARKQK